MTLRSDYLPYFVILLVIIAWIFYLARQSMKPRRRRSAASQRHERFRTRGERWAGGAETWEELRRRRGEQDSWKSPDSFRREGSEEPRRPDAPMDGGGGGR